MHMKTRTNLKRLRGGQLLTQHDLADKSGLPFWRVVVIESGRSKPRPVEARKLARALGVGVDALGVEVADVAPHQPR